jgi:hypothetical protein
VQDFIVTLSGANIHESKISVSCDMLPYSSLEVIRSFGGAYRLLQQGQPSTCLMVVSCLVFSFTRKMERTCCSETPVNFRRTTRHYIPEDIDLHKHCCESLKFYKNEIPSTIIQTVPLHPKEKSQYIQCLRGGNLSTDICCARNACLNLSYENNLYISILISGKIPSGRVRR